MPPRSHRGRGPRGGPGSGPLDAGRVRHLDLRTLDTPSGGATVVTAAVPIDPVTLAGQQYTADPAEPELRLDVVRTGNGWHLRVRGRVGIAGPCWRCLAPAEPSVVLDATEVSEDGSTDPDLTSLYLDHGVLDVAAWARDAMVEAMPATVLCRDDCLGLCPTCGHDRNTGPCACPPPPPDSRWKALEGLAERLREDPQG